MLRISCLPGGEDYVALRESLTFNRSVSVHYLSIGIVDDLVLEGMQEFTIRLETSRPELVFIPPEGSRATVEIKDGSTSGLCNIVDKSKYNLQYFYVNISSSTVLQYYYNASFG